MNFLQKIKTAPYFMLPNRAGYGVTGHGALGFAVDKAERYAAAYGFGVAKGYYREKMLWRGLGADLWLGAGFTLGSAVLLALSNGTSTIAPHLDRLGDAGIMSYLNSMGAAWGNKKAGRTVQVLQGGRALPSLPTSSGVIGAIPQAMGGSYLTAEELAHFSEKR